MQLNMNPSKVAFLDFEVQSNCDLSKGVRTYASHHSTRALTCVVKVGGQIHRLGPYLSPADLRFLEAVSEENVIVAHNAPFDSAIWERTLKLPECEWFDTLPPARASGLPGPLDAIGHCIEGRGKDPNGRRLLELLCILGDRPPPAVGPAHRLLMEYNVRDVELLEAVFSRVRGFGERDVVPMDAAVNARGVPVDGDRLQALRELYRVNAEVQGRNFDEFTDGINPNSPKQVREWLKSIGFDMPNVNKWALGEVYADPEQYYEGDSMAEDLECLKLAMQYRSEVVRVGRGKAERAAECWEGGRIYDMLVYFGAHTGRWSGRALQVHNLPSNVNQFIDVRTLEPTLENVRAAAAEASERIGQRMNNADVLNAMLRSLIRCDCLSTADYGAVEARGTAWVAGEARQLELFADPAKSVYLDMGKAVYGREISKKAKNLEYTFAKSLVLGCGYGMSGKKFGLTCKLRGISTDVDTLKAVRTYREAYPAIPAVWDAYHKAIHEAVRGGQAEAGKCTFFMAGRDLHCMLPSGRPIVYRNARVELRVPSYCKTYGMREVPVPTIVFDSPRPGVIGFIYGSKVTENVVQAISRDLLAQALVDMESEGLKPCLHVHDEAVCETDKLERMLEIMSTPPAWAAGFPLLAEGNAGPVWSKFTKGYREVSYISGRRV